jgi:CDP-diacylglycerol pyrophosphatase
VGLSKAGPDQAAHGACDASDFPAPDGTPTAARALMVHPAMRALSLFEVSMNRKVRFVFALIVLLAVLAAAYDRFVRGNPHALWEIVSQQCVPNQKENGQPAPCLKVDLDQQYVVFKDRRGPYHDLIMPTGRVTGIESPLLQEPGARSFFADAWNERGRLAQAFGRPIDDRFLSFAINSKYGRSQDQLHIHVSCLKPDVYRLLAAEQRDIGPDWRPLAQRIDGHVYLARRLGSDDLVSENPFRILDAYARGQDDSIAKFGLAVVKLQDGGMALLANRLDVFMGFNRGSAEEIQDFTCAVAGGAAGQ